jgi:chorismate mutase/prephenate dehydratase
MKIGDSPASSSATDCFEVPDGDSTSPLRTRIEQIDRQILTLLADRGDLAHEIAKGRRELGKSTLDPAEAHQRILALEQYWKEHPNSKFPQQGLHLVFREIFSVCDSINTPLRIAYMGPPGTFSHLAAIQAFGSAPNHVECRTIANVFSSVERSESDFGVVPIENSIEGGVTHTHDCLLRSNLRICGELVLDVRLCLVALQDDVNQIERVYSHPQPLAQSQLWVSTHLPRAESIACTSTTTAAQQAAADPNSAAIASILSAELYNLRVLAKGIEDIPGNATRFVTIAAVDAHPTGHDKTSVVFSTPDERGALMQVLSIFDSEGLNLSRIESRPDRARRWEYVFFTDIAGHRTDPALQRALKRLQSQCQMVQILGSYPQATQPIPAARQVVFGEECSRS